MLLLLPSWIALLSIRARGKGFNITYSVTSLDIRLHSSYVTILAPVKDMARRHIASWERGRCPRVGLQPAPGRLGYQSPGIMTGTGGASLDWDRRRRVTPVQTASQEAWPEAEPLGWNNSLG